MNDHTLVISSKLVQKIKGNTETLNKYEYESSENYFNELLNQINQKYDFLNVTNYSELDNSEEEEYKTFNGYIKGEFKNSDYNEVVVSFTDLKGKEGNTFLSQQFTPYITNRIMKDTNFLSDTKILKIGVITTHKSNGNIVKENSSIVHTIKCCSTLGYENIMMFKLFDSSGNVININEKYENIQEFLKVNNELKTRNLMNNQVQNIEMIKENKYVFKYSKKPVGQENKNFVFKAYTFLMLAICEETKVSINNLDICIEGDSTTMALNRYIQKLESESKIELSKDTEDFLLGNKDIALTTSLEYIQDHPDTRIAFSGKWGTGKTYFIRKFITEYSKINEEKNVLLIDSWKLSTLNTLNDMTIASLFEDSKFKKLDKIRQSKELLKSLSKNGIIKILSIYSQGLTDIPVETIKTLNKKLKKHSVMPVNKNNIYEILKKDFGIEYIIVDELDRVVPLVAMNLLSEINYLNSREENKYPKFIVSANFPALEQIMKHQYGSGYESESFFDKLFDRTFELQENTRDKLLYFISQLYENEVQDNIINSVIYIYNDKEGDLTFLNRLTFRKIEWFAKEVAYFEFGENVVDEFTLHVMSLKYTKYSEYLDILSESIEDDKRIQLLNENFLNSEIEHLKKSLKDIFEIDFKV